LALLLIILQCNGRFEKETKNLREISKKPIVIQEFGVPSLQRDMRGSNQEDQAHYPKKMKALFKKNNFAFMSWTLYFPHV
jgi:hypothetical protein